MGLFNIFKKKENIQLEKVNLSKNEDYLKAKKLSYWIFNNYGIPVRKAVSVGGDFNNFKLFSTLPFKTFKSNPEQNQIYYEIPIQIINEYLLEYSKLIISFNDDNFKAKYLDNEDSILILKEKDIYTEERYNYLESNYQTCFFLCFDFDKISNPNIKKEPFQALQGAMNLTSKYKEIFGDVNKPNLITPSPGLSFEEFKIDKIKEEAIEEGINYEEYFETIKTEVEIISKEKFIPFQQIYCNPLMDTVRWGKGFCYLGVNNEVIYEPSNLFYGEN
jgi:hypothetical protein